jgi:hypothetical protein
MRQAASPAPHVKSAACPEDPSPKTASSMAIAAAPALIPLAGHAATM